MKNKMILLSIAASSLSLSALASDTGLITCTGTVGSKTVVLTQEIDSTSGKMESGCKLALSVDGERKALPYSQLSSLYVSPYALRKNSPLIMMDLQNDGTEIILAVEYLGPKKDNKMMIPGAVVNDGAFTVEAKNVSCVRILEL